MQSCQRASLQVSCQVSHAETKSLDVHKFKVAMQHSDDLLPKHRSTLSLTVSESRKGMPSGFMGGIKRTIHQSVAPMQKHRSSLEPSVPKPITHLSLCTIVNHVGQIIRPLQTLCLATCIHAPRHNMPAEPQAFKKLMQISSALYFDARPGQPSASIRPSPSAQALQSQRLYCTVALLVWGPPPSST